MKGNEQPHDSGPGATNRFFAFRRQQDWLDGSKPLRLIVNIDVSGVCNLRCPSCPQGCPGLTQSRSRKQFMEVESFGEVVKKIRSESPSEHVTVALYNWGEPLLHPDIEQLLHIANDAGFATSLSSNMAHAKNLEAAVRGSARYFRASLSGLSEKTYGFYHSGGDSRIVVENLYRFKELRQRYGQDKPLPEVVFHWYKDNLGEDYEQVSELCRDLGFRLVNKIARLYPLERALGGLQDGWRPSDEELLDRLLITPEEFASIAQEHTPEDEPCILQNAEISINADGSVLLCCVCYEDENIIANSFLDVSMREIFDRKAVHPTCTRCKAVQYHQSGSLDAHPAVLQAARRRLGGPLPGDEAP